MIAEALARIAAAPAARFAGRVRRVSGTLVECEGLRAPVGAVCAIENGPRCEVVGVREDGVLALALGDTAGVRAGDAVTSVGTEMRVPVGEALLGRVIDAEGVPLDGAGPVRAPRRGVAGRIPGAMARARATRPLPTGVRAIDALLTCARGQRIGLFSGSGVGKTTLLGMIARGTAADVVVLGLVGERGREVRDFVERDLGSARARCVVVAETADRPAVRRVKAAFAASAVAESFRDEGRDVLLLVDSLSRVASAQREVGLAAGEPPGPRGMPASVYAMLPRLLERAGALARGSVTGFYSVLAEADDPNDPVADAARSVLDGHVWLSRAIAQRGRYPAVDVVASLSRLMRDVVEPGHAAAAARVRSLLAAHREAEDLLSVGAYAKGSDPDVDRAIRLKPAIDAFLGQRTDEAAEWPATLEALARIAREAEA